MIIIIPSSLREFKILISSILLINSGFKYPLTSSSASIADAPIYLLVIIIIVFLKLIVLPSESLIEPSSKICNNKFKTPG